MKGASMASESGGRPVMVSLRPAVDCLDTAVDAELRGRVSEAWERRASE